MLFRCAFFANLGDGGISRFGGCEYIATIVSNEVGLPFIKLIQGIERGVEGLDGGLQLSCLCCTLFESSYVGQSCLSCTDGSKQSIHCRLRNFVVSRTDAYAFGQGLCIGYHAFKSRCGRVFFDEPFRVCGRIALVAIQQRTIFNGITTQITLTRSILQGVCSIGKHGNAPLSKGVGVVICPCGIPVATAALGHKLATAHILQAVV